MQLYFSPLACSLATRIALYESDATAELVEVDSHTKRTADGTDYRTIHALGLVPAVRLDDGELLTENAAILQVVCEALAPADARGRARVQQWLCFIGTELHKGVFAPLLDKTAPPQVKQYALSKADERMAYVANHLANREFLVDQLSVADAYLFTILNWTAVTPIKLATWPTLSAYMSRLHARDAFARAFAEERELYVREQAKRH